MSFALHLNIQEEAAARRDGFDHAIRSVGNRCEDCGESVKGLAVFECSGPACATGMFCCPDCATMVGAVTGVGGCVHGWVRETRPRWTSVVLVRDGMARPRVVVTRAGTS